MAEVFKLDLRRVMAAHGINSQQAVHQLLLMNLIAATSKPKPGCFTVSRHLIKVSQAFYDQSMLITQQDPSDEIISPGKELVGTRGVEPPAVLSGNQCYSSSSSQFENRTFPEPPHLIQMLQSCSSVIPLDQCR